MPITQAPSCELIGLTFAANHLTKLYKESRIFSIQSRWTNHLAKQSPLASNWELTLPSFSTTILENIAYFQLKNADQGEAKRTKQSFALKGQKENVLWREDTLRAKSFASLKF